MTRVLALTTCALLAACCGPEFQALRHDERGKLDECTHFVVLATVLEGYVPDAEVVAAVTTASIATTSTRDPPGADPVTGVVATELGASPWVYVTPALPDGLPDDVAAAWRPPTTRGGVEADVRTVLEDGDDHERLIGAASRSAREVLELRGLLPGAAPAGERTVFVGVSYSTEGSPSGRRLVRVAVHAGSDLDGKFVRDLTSLQATFPPDCAPTDPLEEPLALTVRALVEALPLD